MFKGIIEFIRKGFNIRLILPFTLFLGLVCFFYFDFDLFLSWSNVKGNYSELSLQSSENYIYSAIIFFFIYFTAAAFSLPIITILVLLGGALFGWLAFLLCIFAGTLGCWVVFLATKGFLFNYLSKKTNPYISSITTNFNKGQFTWLFTLKLFPFLPISVSNIIAGVLGMSSSIFLLATFLAFIPGTLIWVAFGKRIDRFITSDESISLSMFDNPDIFIPMMGLFLLSLASFIVKFLRIKKGNY